jgi:hypothetical protein
MASNIAPASARPPARSTATGRAPAREAISGYSGYDGQGVTSSSPGESNVNAVGLKQLGAAVAHHDLLRRHLCRSASSERIPPAWRSG